MKHHFIISFHIFHRKAYNYDPVLTAFPQTSIVLFRKRNFKFEFIKIKTDLLILYLFHRFGRNANNYDLVITACRHYWNASLPLINQPIERELLVEPVSMILEYIADVTDKDKYKKKEVRFKEEKKRLLIFCYSSVSFSWSRFR